MASPLRAKALAAKDIKSELVPVPAWDCTFDIRGLTGEQRGKVVARATLTEQNAEGEEVSRVDATLLNPLIVIASCYDPDSGEQVFEDADADAINGKSAEALDTVTKVALRLSGMTKDERKAMEKNSDATATGAGASA